VPYAICKENMFNLLKKSFSEAVLKITAACESTCSEKEIEQKINEFEVSLLQANVSEGVAVKICEKLRAQVKPLTKKSEIEKIFRKTFGDALIKVLDLPKIDLLKEIEKQKPFIILFVGANGVGKTTTIAKLVNYLKMHGKKCALGAADTFRAAAIEQISIWAKELDIPIIKHKYKSDPAAVAFDAVNYAKANKIDVVLIDTAGRSNTNTNLTNELKKIKRIAKPNLTIAVVDALTGNDGVNQVAVFEENLGVDAIIISKLDADEIGGGIVSLAYEFKKPILFVGTGQTHTDLEEYDKENILNRILTKEK